MRMGWRSMVAGAVLAASITVPQAARAEFLEDAGWGTLTVLSNVLYMPAKVLYATTGGITGGFAYGLTIVIGMRMPCGLPSGFFPGRTWS